MTYFPSTEEKAQQEMLEQQRKVAGAEREEKRQEWLAEDLEVVKSTRTDWRDNEAGWEGVTVKCDPQGMCAE